MATKADWGFLRDVLVSLDKRVQNGEVVQGPDAWALPADLTGDMARDYIEAARRRLEEVEQAVKLAMQSPIQRVQSAGEDVGSLVREGAKRAAKIAKDVASAAEKSLDDLARRMEESGENIAIGIGMGTVVVIAIALLLLREARA